MEYLDFAICLLMTCLAAFGFYLTAQRLHSKVMREIRKLMADILRYGQKFSVYQMDWENKLTNLRDKLDALKETIEFQTSEIENQKMLMQSQTGRIESQKRLIECQTSEIETMKKEMKATTTRMQTDFGIQKEAISGIREEMTKGRPEISFSAYPKSDLSFPEVGRVILFDGVNNNEGGAYDPATGIFTVPVNGTYFFHAGILSNNQGEFVIHVESKGQIAYMLTDFVGRFDTAVCSVIVHLEKGEKVWVKSSFARGHCTFYVHHVWSFFSGFLVHGK